MTYLFLSVLSSTVIFVTFKVTEKYKVNLIKLITVNYLVAAVLGFSFNHHHLSIASALTSKWMQFALLIGVSYILMFFLIGYSTRKSGITVTTIASKLSMIIPILFSMLYFGEKNTTLKVLGLGIALVAVLLTCYRPIDKTKNIKLIALPIIIFIGTGFTDSIVKYAQTYHIPNHMSMLFPAVVFSTSLITGILITFLNPKYSLKSLTISEIVGGIVLGIANFGSLYFFIQALNNSKIDSSIVFGLNSLCIVLLSLLFGLVLFREKFSKVNFAGIGIAIIAILILMSF